MIFTLSANGQSTEIWFKAESDNLIGNNHYLDCDIASDNAGSLTFVKKDLFVFTHPKIRKVMPEDNLIEAQGNIMKVKENTFLILTIKINSSNARSSYGDLNQGAQLKCMFKGKNNYIYLENLERDKGKINKEDEYTIYQGVFPISKSKQKDLKKNDLFKVGIVWEEGYEEYEIFNIDLIRNQLNCL